MTLALPDFGLSHWDEVQRVRESHAGGALRRKITTICDDITGALPDVKTKQDIDDVVKRHVFDDVLEEVRSNRISKGQIALDVALNLIPYAGFFGTARDIYSKVQQDRSWVSLLR